MEIYVHLPFCVKKCNYCDFFSGAFCEKTQEDYVQMLLNEIEDTCFLGQVSSVFFGGGTPSLLRAEMIEKILEKIRAKFEVSENAEISIECNPGTVTFEKLCAYQKMGINRLSFGLQSTDDALLKKLGRIHTYETFLQSYRDAKKAGFENINIDLISGVPGTTFASNEETLKNVIALKPTHISVYSLIIEEGTPFYALYNEENGTQKESCLSEEEDRQITTRTNELLEQAGYEHYEISNYAIPGYACQHNIGYWTGAEYLGFGAAASSYIAHMRFKNALSLHYYDLPYIETEMLSKEAEEAEFFITGLRMMAGVSDADFQKRFHHSFFDSYKEVIQKHVNLGTLIQEKDRIFLTKYGIDVSNAVLCDFI